MMNPLHQRTAVGKRKRSAVVLSAFALGALEWQQPAGPLLSIYYAKLPGPMQIPIRRTIERIPGGMMVVPLLAGALIHTCAPHTGEFFGSFTGALFEGALPILAVFYVCIGSSIAVRSIPQVVRRGGALLGTKIALGIGAGFFLGHFLGTSPVRAGLFAGLSTLAVVAAINDTNGGLYMALMNQYGRAEDAAAYSVMALESGPFLTMVTLGVAGLASFPWQTMLGAVIPLLIGMVLGNLDAEMRSFLGGAAPVMIPFFAFALGATLNLKQVWAAGLTGIGLGVAILLLSAAALGVVDRLIGGTGIAGMAAATTAGNAAAVPALIAAADRKYAAVAASATVLVASSVVVTTILAPVLTAWWDLRTRRGPAKWIQQRKCRMLALADDLTGATDCAAACAFSSIHAVVVLDGSEWPDAELLVLDANTRCMGQEQAVAQVSRLVLDHARSADRIFFKKVDSTLRGHLAAELRAVLDIRRKAASRRVVAILAPAFPAQGRTTVDGQLLVHGVPLENADLWDGEPQPPRSNIPELLADADLRSAVVSLETIRKGRTALERDFVLRAREADVLVCDAETEADLALIAEASLVLGPATVWAGSAGFARHLVQVSGWRGQPLAVPPLKIAPAPVLFVMGSRSRISREQSEALAATGDVLVQRIPVDLLRAGAQSAEWRQQEQQLRCALAEGRDVLVLPDDDGIRQPEHAVCAGMAQLLSGCADAVGALVATGGQTARAVLDTWGIKRLRLRGEVEPGLAFSVAEGWWRAIPILTKAGGFGRPDTLVNCRRFLQELGRSAAEAREAAARE